MEVINDASINAAPITPVDVANKPARPNHKHPCAKCGRNFNDISHLERHLARKRPCVFEEPNAAVVLNGGEVQAVDGWVGLPPGVQVKVPHHCDWCKRTYANVSNLNKHKHFCRLRPQVEKDGSSIARSRHPRAARNDKKEDVPQVVLADNVRDHDNAHADILRLRNDVEQSIRKLRQQMKEQKQTFKELAKLVQEQNALLRNINQ